MANRSHTLRARWIAPVASPPIENGIVVIRDGRIVDVGRFGTIDPLGEIEDLGDVVLLPGLINAHTHLELSHVPRSDDPPASLGTWLLEIVQRRSQAAIQPAEAVQQSIEATTRAGAAECLRFGVTCVGDITHVPAVTRGVLRAGPLRVVSFGEVRAMGGRRNRLGAQVGAAIDPRAPSRWLSNGISPHAPYSAEPHVYEACIGAARALHIRICTHLAESREESLFLSEHCGPLRELWDVLGDWDAEVPRFAGSPVEFAASVGLLDLPSLLAHVNYASNVDLDRLAASPASIVFCPRTHAFFRHEPHRWYEMLARGINVCVGTDSRASSPDLNVVEDLRLMHRDSPAVEPSALWEMVTTRAARALEQSDLGAIAMGFRADLVAFATRTGDPMREVLEVNVEPMRVWIEGEPVAINV